MCIPKIRLSETFLLFLLDNRRGREGKKEIRCRTKGITKSNILLVKKKINKQLKTLIILSVRKKKKSMNRLDSAREAWGRKQ